MPIPRSHPTPAPSGTTSALERMEHMRKLRRPSAFTLLELIVVVSIILVLAGGSIAMLSMFGRGSAVKHGGRIVQSQFYRARQLSASTRVWHFLVIESVIGANPPASVVSRMTIFKDDLNTGNVADQRKWDPTDDIVGTSVEMPKGAIFKVEGQGTTPGAGAGLPYSAPRGLLVLAFRPDGSVGADTPGGRSDLGTPAYGAQHPVADLVIAQNDNGGGCMIDWSYPAGKVLKILYDPRIISGW